MQTIQLGSNIFEYDDGGSGKNLLLMSGWCQDHRLFKNIIDPLRERYRVIRLNWRGHDAARAYDGDFTTEDQVDDVAAFLDAKGIAEVVPLSCSHGGWANIGVAGKMGLARVPKVIVIDWLMISAFTDLMAALRKSQEPAFWKEGRDSLFNEWLHKADCEDASRHVWDEMASFDEEMWVRSCREIEVAYAKWQSPLARIQAFAPTRPVTHIYSQPIDADYDTLQREFAKAHPWFTPTKIEGKTHFPTLESPEAVVQAISSFVG